MRVQCTHAPLQRLPHAARGLSLFLSVSISATVRCGVQRPACTTWCRTRRNRHPVTAPRPNTRHNVLVRAVPHVRPGRLHRPRTAEDLRQQHVAVKLDAKSPLSPTTVSGDTIGFGHAMWATDSLWEEEVAIELDAAQVEVVLARRVEPLFEHSEHLIALRGVGIVVQQPRCRGPRACVGGYMSLCVQRVCACMRAHAHARVRVRVFVCARQRWCVRVIAYACMVPWPTRL